MCHALLPVGLFRCGPQLLQQDARRSAACRAAPPRGVAARPCRKAARRRRAAVTYASLGVCAARLWHATRDLHGLRLRRVQPVSVSRNSRAGAWAEAAACPTSARPKLQLGPPDAVGPAPGMETRRAGEAQVQTWCHDALWSVNGRRVFPVGPGAIGVLVVRGPDFGRSGFGDQATCALLGHLSPVFLMRPIHSKKPSAPSPPQDGWPGNLGRTQLPDAATIKEWAKEEWSNPGGGWSPQRSLAVKWLGQEGTFYYKAGDRVGRERRGWYDVGCTDALGMLEAGLPRIWSATTHLHHRSANHGFALHALQAIRAHKSNMKLSMRDYVDELKSLAEEDIVSGADPELVRAKLKRILDYETISRRREKHRYMDFMRKQARRQPHSDIVQIGGDSDAPSD